jgi:hypothetical protein
MDKRMQQLDRVVEFAVDAIINMIGGGSETLNMLDYEDGREVDQEPADVR